MCICAYPPQRQDTEEFQHRTDPCIPGLLFDALSSSLIIVITNLFSISKILSFWKCYINGIKQYLILKIYFFYLSLIP